MNETTRKFSDAIIIAEINRRLTKHPGDAPWSCVECYHGRPCKDAQILRAALACLEHAPAKKEVG